MQTRVIHRLITVALFVVVFSIQAQPSSPQQRFSTAGFFELPGSGREAFDFNAGWRFLKSDAPDAEKPAYDDAAWEVVNLPHGLELLPSEASGGINYRGPAWYRKHFRLPKIAAGKRLLLHFEAIMGKSRVWLDGKLVAEHLGGYLPVVIDLSDAGLDATREHVIAVRADNSDDDSYPPGKPQAALDFCYFGGIYRDVWLVATGPVYITDPQLAERVAGGGVFAHFENVGTENATVLADTEVANASPASAPVKIITTLRDANGAALASATNELTLAASATQSARAKLVIPHPHVWHPDDPYLHWLETRVTTEAGAPLDGFRQRIGIRSIEFRGADGFFLNGQPFGDKLIGVNRHQDFAYVGNALPNSGQWRDAKKLRDAGLRIIRSAHYPQDPAFMDACDELGLFVIVATPGWQYWNAAPSFAGCVVSDIRHIVRRDRNHPSVIFYEPILNETRYPAAFARRAYDAVHEEQPFGGGDCACDLGSAGDEFYDVIYTHPLGSGKTAGKGKRYDDFKQSSFTREWGDNVDDWSAQNSPSRVPRTWGEAAQLKQAIHYADPPYPFTCWDSLYRTPAQHVGGCLWAGFDCQRGYHPDPFWGGILDVFRQPKYSYELFRSQRNPAIKLPFADSGPMIFIANEMTPVSEKDVVIFSNCEEVRLSVFGDAPITQKVVRPQPGIPHPPVVFTNAFDFMRLKALSRAKKTDQVKLVAEGLIAGEVVVRTEKMPALRPEQIILWLDDAGMPLIADGSDIVPVIAAVADEAGHIRRLEIGEVEFSIEGQGSLVGDARNGANPRRIEWGTAPALVRATMTAGEIIVQARLTHEGEATPHAGSLKFTSRRAVTKMIYQEVAGGDRAVAVRDLQPVSDTDEVRRLKEQLEQNEIELQRLRLREVERDQEDFEGLPGRANSGGK